MHTHPFKSSVKKLLVLYFFFLSSVAWAQNLVPNGSFEQFKVCPGSFFLAPAEFTVPGWKPAGLGTPDHFHYCSRGEAGIPYNWAGVSEAYDGDGYAGLYLWFETSTDYREYLQCLLTEPLKKDSTYYVEFHYKLASYANFCIDRIGLLFTSDGKTIPNDKVINTPPSLQIRRDSALTIFTGSWEAARFEYKATGGENSLMIGNFSTDDETKSYRIRSRSISDPMLSQASYYFVDGVIVVPKFRILQQLDTKILPAFSPETAALNTPYALKSIQFEFNKAELGPLSFPQLDQLADYLKQHEELNIQVSGHTDDVGEDQYNLELSRKRAENVGLYLQRKGIDRNRLTTVGFGESQPLIQSTSEDARKLNRRVEVKFTK